MDCIFCKIVAGEIPCDKVYEDDNVLAFLDIHPIRSGHTLIIPKEHSENFVLTKLEKIHAVVDTAQKIAPAILKAVGANSFNLTTANGAGSGQSVFHLHFHIIPRTMKNELQDWPQMQDGLMSRGQIAEMIRKNLI